MNARISLLTASESDDLNEIVAKFERWHAEGSFVVLLDPKKKQRTTWGDRPEAFPELTAG